MTNQHDKNRALQGSDDAALDVRPSSADLLDLVRTAEDDARLALRKRTPAVATVLSGLSRPIEEDFVDVGDDAVEAPPSMPPMRVATPAASASLARASSSAGKRADMPRGLPPALGILLILALAVGAIALVTR